MDITLIVILIIAALLVFWLVGIYNRLVSLKNRYENAFSQIEVQLKRRYDLIPNLVETARAYMSHERDTLQAVTEARSQAIKGLQAAAAAPGNPEAMQSLTQAEGMLTSALGRLNIAVEAYPDLKASQNMMQLSEELTSTENKVAFSRQSFNDAVTAYNTFRQSFPTIMVAGTFGHGQDASLLQFEDSAVIQQAPKVSF